MLIFCTGRSGQRNSNSIRAWKKMIEGLVAKVVTELTEYSQKSSGDKLVNTDHFSHRILITGTKKEGKFQVCADRGKCYTSKSI
jgi:hypothetical protein